MSPYGKHYTTTGFVQKPQSAWVTKMQEEELRKDQNFILARLEAQNSNRELITYNVRNRKPKFNAGLIYQPYVANFTKRTYSIYFLLLSITMPTTSSADIAPYVTNSIVVVAILIAASYFNVFLNE